MITCKLCGKRFKDIGGLSKHRSKSHPGAGKRKKTSGKGVAHAGNFCPTCGRKM